MRAHLGSRKSPVINLRFHQQHPATCTLAQGLKQGSLRLNLISIQHWLWSGVGATGIAGSKGDG